MGDAKRTIGRRTIRISHHNQITTAARSRLGSRRFDERSNAPYVPLGKGTALCAVLQDKSTSGRHAPGLRGLRVATSMRSRHLCVPGSAPGLICPHQKALGAPEHSDHSRGRHPPEARHVSVASRSLRVTGLLPGQDRPPSQTILLRLARHPVARRSTTRFHVTKVSAERRQQQRTIQ